MFNPGPYLFYLTFCFSLALLELLWTGMKFQLGKTCQSHNFKIRLFFVIPSCRLKEDFYDMSSFRLISHKLCYNNCRQHSSPIVSTLNFALRCFWDLARFYLCVVFFGNTQCLPPPGSINGIYHFAWVQTFFML